MTVLTRSGSFPANSMDSLSLASWWLQNCRTTHHQCQDIQGTRRLPTRLLVVNEPELRICLSEAISASSVYATLSHCWGSKNYLSLTKDNFASFCIGIPEHGLSQTIIDAIKAARILGFCYLWVDTLCIIQDDKDDWARESSLMSAVYGGSDLNIAATSAEDGSQGCFRDRSRLSRCDVDLKSNGNSNRHKIVPRWFRENYLERTPLLRRGWVLQERLLSRRTLHFANLEVFWECHQVQADETFPKGAPHDLFGDVAFRKQSLSPSMWPWIVKAYSRCQLTYATDKFVAISGVAQLIHCKAPDEYYAGSWRKSFEQQLCWFIFGPDREEPTRNQTYIAPTWSWACASKPVNTANWTSDVDGLWARLLNVDIEYMTHDVFGAVTNAKIYMSCTLLAHFGNFLDGNRWTEVFSDYSDTQSDNQIDSNTRTHHDAAGRSGTRSQPNTTLNDGSGARFNLCFALPVMASNRFIHGIILRASQMGQGIYTRIGYFTCDLDELEWRCAHAADPLVDEKHCFEVRTGEDGKPVHVIEII